MIEIIKCIFGIIILVGIYNQVESKAFKFEKFESGEEATKYLRKHYPVGSDVEILFKDLKKVGAKISEKKKSARPRRV